MRTKEEIAEYQREYRAKNAERLKAYKLDYDNKHRESLISKAKEKRHSVYYVYSHINDKNELYIGSGTKRRPYSFTDRKATWNRHFSKDTVGVAILKECNTLEQARIIEDSIIRAIGLDKLVNCNNVSLK
jgi:hypothetical protein